MIEGNSSLSHTGLAKFAFWNASRTWVRLRHKGGEYQALSFRANRRCTVLVYPAPPLVSGDPR